MGIWIRSQEGKRLVRCEALTVRAGLPQYAGKPWGPRANTGLFEVSGYIGPEPDEGGFLLGEYPTEAEALRVLDMIQTHIGRLAYTQFYKSDQDFVIPIFQMPPAGFSEEVSHG